MRKFTLLAGMLALGACAQATSAVNSDATAENITAKTATYFNTSTSNVRVGNFRSTLVGTAYTAQVGNRTFDCQYLRGNITCAKL